jgi:3-deoxy-manno-octulosonate cytidylyltransferase (CMP-KDO synthetase)
VRVAVVIPARMASTRLPGKPLADIHGRPMIAWMVEAGLKAGVGPVIVAAGEAEIAEAAQAAGARAALTDPGLPSGTDRVAAAIADVDADVIVNLQGDMPTIDPGLIGLALNALGQADIATLVCPSERDEDRANPNVVKAVVSFPDAPPGGAKVGRALYFTRAGAPYGEGPILRHVGLYVYARAALARFVAAPPSPLERRESLEQLRALEMGMTIAVGLADSFPKGVDSPADLEAARAALAPR